MSALHTLLVMAYNVGRSHGELGTMSKEEGRRVMAQQLLQLVDDLDPGDLARPFADVLEGLAR